MSAKFACPDDGFSYPEVEPRLFSFNNPFGACPACDGLGIKLAFDADLVIPDRDKTLHKGAVAPWSRGPSPLYTQTLQSLSRHYGFSMDVAIDAQNAQLLNRDDIGATVTGPLTLKSDGNGGVTLPELHAARMAMRWRIACLSHSVAPKALRSRT